MRGIPNFSISYVLFYTISPYLYRVFRTFWSIIVHTLEFCLTRAATRLTRAAPRSTGAAPRLTRAATCSTRAAPRSTRAATHSTRAARRSTRAATHSTRAAHHSVQNSLTRSARLHQFTDFTISFTSFSINCNSSELLGVVASINTFNINIYSSIWLPSCKIFFHKSTTANY